VPRREQRSVAVPGGEEQKDASAAAGHGPHGGEEQQGTGGAARGRYAQMETMSRPQRRTSCFFVPPNASRPRFSGEKPFLQFFFSVLIKSLAMSDYSLTWWVI